MTGSLGEVEMGGAVALVALHPLIVQGAMNGAPGFICCQYNV